MHVKCGTCKAGHPPGELLSPRTPSPYPQPYGWLQWEMSITILLSLGHGVWIKMLAHDSWASRSPSLGFLKLGPFLPEWQTWEDVSSGTVRRLGSGPKEKTRLWKGRMQLSLREAGTKYEERVQMTFISSPELLWGQFGLQGCCCHCGSYGPLSIHFYLISKLFCASPLISKYLSNITQDSLGVPGIRIISVSFRRRCHLNQWSVADNCLSKREQWVTALGNHQILKSHG